HGRRRQQRGCREAPEARGGAFLAGDVPGALRLAQKAQAQVRSLPGLAGALAAYEVHHAAAEAASGKKKNSSWCYAVLGIAVRTPSQVTHEALKGRYRRFCLALHPDKNRSAAAEGAFKLLQDAWAALSALHPPAPAAHKQPKPGPEKTGSSYTGAGDGGGGGGWRPREFRSVFCVGCGSEYRMPVDEDVGGPAGFKCGFCSRGEYPPPPPPPPRTNGFPCPGKCPGFGAPYARCRVSVGTWWVRCVACRLYAKLDVRTPYAFSHLDGGMKREEL
ncbi:uncharacterized protein LOC112270045, partial [Brachypodium distachyon]|uniref:uncharacterized protein LOC112270045 n=1 Tax=Brachypodium distachyon TaxID=15368 RepID=UPI000D0DD96C